MKITFVFSFASFTKGQVCKYVKVTICVQYLATITSLFHQVCVMGSTLMIQLLPRANGKVHVCVWMSACLCVISILLVSHQHRHKPVVWANVIPYFQKPTVLLVNPRGGSGHVPRKLTDKYWTMNTEPHLRASDPYRGWGAHAVHKAEQAWTQFVLF